MKFTAEEKAKILDYYEEGKSFKEMAEIMQKDPQAIAASIRKHKERERFFEMVKAGDTEAIAQSVPPLEKRCILNLHRSGKEGQEIADIVGIRTTVVLEIINQYEKKKINKPRAGRREVVDQLVQILLTFESKQFIFDLYKKGISFETIGQMFGRCSINIKNIVIRYKYEMDIDDKPQSFGPRQELEEEDRHMLERLIAKFTEGTLDDIITIFQHISNKDVSRDTISSAIERFGLKIGVPRRDQTKAEIKIKRRFSHQVQKVKQESSLDNESETYVFGAFNRSNVKRKLRNEGTSRTLHKRMTMEEKKELAHYYELGKSIDEIAELTQKDKHTVICFIKGYKKKGLALTPLQKKCVLNLRKCGKKGPEITRIVHLSPVSVRRCIKLYERRKDIHKSQDFDERLAKKSRCKTTDKVQPIKMTSEGKEMIWMLYQKGISYEDMGLMFVRSPNYIRQVIRKFQQDMGIEEVSQQTLDDEDRWLLERLVAEFPNATLDDIISAFQNLSNKQVTKKVVRLSIKQFGLKIKAGRKDRVKSKKPSKNKEMTFLTQEASYSGGTGIHTAKKQESLQAPKMENEVVDIGSGITHREGMTDSDDDNKTDSESSKTLVDIFLKRFPLPYSGMNNVIGVKQEKESESYCAAEVNQDTQSESFCAIKVKQEKETESTCQEMSAVNSINILDPNICIKTEDPIEFSLYE